LPDLLELFENVTGRSIIGLVRCGVGREKENAFCHIVENFTDYKSYSYEL